MLKQRAGYSDGAESRASGVEVHLVFVGAGEEGGGRGLSRPEREKIYFFFSLIFPLCDCCGSHSLGPCPLIIVLIQILFFLFLTCVSCEVNGVSYFLMQHYSYHVGVVGIM